MCGRFVQAQSIDAYAQLLEVDEIKTEALAPNWNVAPTDQVYAAAEHDGVRQLGTFRWGLIPFWAKDRKIGARNINARSETVAEKATFRDSFVRKRCLIPADGFYEWEVKERGKLPHYFHSSSGAPLAFAGLWASWRDRETNEKVKTCSIITGTPNTLVQPIHDRMPVMLRHEAWASWLDPATDDPEFLQSLLVPLPERLLAEFPVSTLVNSVKNNIPECIVPLESGAVSEEL